jgi:hypothetical protein
MAARTSTSIAVAVAASAAIAAAGPAPAQIAAIAAYGSLSGFDVFNDDPGGREAEGFDIEIEGASAADVLGESTDNRYGGPRIIAYDDTPVGGGKGIIIRYAAAWNGSAWILPPASSAFGTGTPYVGPDTITPRMGHQCVYGATAAYATSGCEHYGIALAYRPNIAKISYYWLYDEGLPKGLSGRLVRGLPASLPTQPIIVYNPPPAGLPPVVVERVKAAPEPPPPSGKPETQFGDAVWVKVFTSVSPIRADLDRLVTGGNTVPQTGYVWHLLQQAPKDGQGKPIGGERDDVEKEPIPEGAAQVTKRYEYYRFGNNRITKPILAGLYDRETHRALCETFYATKQDAANALYNTVRPPPVQIGCRNANGDDQPYEKTYWTLNSTAKGRVVAQVKDGNLGSYIGAAIVGANIK